MKHSQLSQLTHTISLSYKAN